MNRRNFFSYLAGAAICIYTGNTAPKARTRIFGPSNIGLKPSSVPLYGSHIHNPVTVSLGREPLFELGRKSPYFRYMEFPVEVSEKLTLKS